MAHPLDGSRARIERAGDHIEALDAVLARFARDGSFRIVGEPDTNTGEYVLRVYSERQPPTPPPLLASVILGDVLNNLRSSLDYVVWQLAESPSTKNQFPIFDDPKRFEKKCPRYLFSVPPERWAKFESYQPYPGRENNRALGVLATLNDADKHRLLLTGATSFAGLRTRFRVSGLDSITVKGTTWVPFEDGAELHRMVLEPHPGSNVKVDASVPYTILFRDPETDTGLTISDLRRLRFSISNVVESFASDFRARHDATPAEGEANGGSPSPPSESEPESGG